MCEMVLLKMRLRMRVWVVVSCVYLYMFEATCYTYEGVLAIYVPACDDGSISPDRLRWSLYSFAPCFSSLQEEYRTSERVSRPAGGWTMRPMSERIAPPYTASLAKSIERAHVLPAHPRSDQRLHTHAHVHTHLHI
jgi:hypothetical protein